MISTTSRVAGLAVALAAVASLALLFLPRPVQRAASDRTEESTTQAPPSAGTKHLPASAVLAIDVTRPSRSAAPAQPPAPKTLAREFEQAQALRPLYDRLRAAGGTETAEAKYVLYRMLDTCAQKKEDIGKPFHKTWEQQRRDLDGAIPQGDRQRALRLRMFDELHRCEGLEGIVTSGPELDRLLDAAASAGDPRARALQVQRDVFGPVVQSPGPPISEEQLRTLRESIASRDPAAIAIAGTMLSNTYGDLVIESSDTHEALDPAASRLAWRLLACDYGLDCGPGNRELRTTCAVQGRCDATTFADLVYFYQITPNEAQLIDRYRRVYRNVIESNDWSALEFARRANTATSGLYRFGYPGP